MGLAYSYRRDIIISIYSERLVGCKDQINAVFCCIIGNKYRQGCIKISVL